VPEARLDLASKSSRIALAPGARVLVRDAEWLVRRLDRTSTGGFALRVIGVSELVRDKEAIFLTEVEKSIEVLDPANTNLVPDTSHAFTASLLYMEALLRQAPPTDENLYLGHRAAMDLVPYQLDPALKALEQPRCRILIADAVGLGKTLEAGILLSELIKRGRGKRILVVTVKSMLTQFQKEMWSRFTIPLTRLDSLGIQRIRSRIPSNHNPFYYYDKAIISVDTLKQDAEYRTYLEKAYWDVIIIDEAHNVAERGDGGSMRSKLAKLLASKSDTLIMLSATPHDGKARSFASLMNMLDPTAIANPEEYKKEDIQGLFIRRFKKDIKDQVRGSFCERTISIAECEASPSEEQAFDSFSDMAFQEIDHGKGAGELFRTTLEKALFSSPSACLETIGNRISRLRATKDPQDLKDIEALESFGHKVGNIGSAAFSKYQKLLGAILDKVKGFGWTGKDTKDRLVIFTERIETLRFLHSHLPKDIGLSPGQIEVLYGTLSDTEQQRIVEDFGKDEAPVRLLIASDVASEGINLHYLCHRMIHFDIPWSLMVFQQRNGRIDRYGQEQTPEIVYLVTKSKNEKIRGDTRILELLIRKDEQAVKNIGDPATLMGVYDVDEEERITAQAIEQGITSEQFEKKLDAGVFDPLALLLGEVEQPTGADASTKTRSLPALFLNDFTYLREGFQYLSQSHNLQYKLYPEEQRVELFFDDELKYRFRNLPPEMEPDDGVFVLSTNPAVIQQEIKRSRKEDRAWPRIHYLWPLNPIVEWLNDKLLAGFGRHEAPVLCLGEKLRPRQTVYLLSGLIPNVNGQPLFQRWFGVTFDGNTFQGIEDFVSLVARLGINTKSLANKGGKCDLAFLKAVLPTAIDAGRHWLSLKWKEFEAIVDDKLNLHLKALDRLRIKKHEQLELSFMASLQSEKAVQSRKERERREIDRIFDEYYSWIERTLLAEDKPYIQVVAVFTGEA
jgi:superfamily II DNA or RNA helicase